MLRDKVKQIIDDRDAYKNKYQTLENILMKYGINTDSIQQIEEDMMTFKNEGDIALENLVEGTKYEDLDRKKNQNSICQQKKENDRLNNYNYSMKSKQKSLYVLPHISSLYGDQSDSIFHPNIDMRIVSDCNSSRRIALEMAVARIKVRRGLMSNNDTSYKATSKDKSLEEEKGNDLIAVNEGNETDVQKIALDISLAKIEEMHKQMIGLCKYNEKLRKRVLMLEKNASYAWKEYY